MTTTTTIIVFSIKMRSVKEQGSTEDLTKFLQHSYGRRSLESILMPVAMGGMCWGANRDNCIVAKGRESIKDEKVELERGNTTTSLGYTGWMRESMKVAIMYSMWITGITKLCWCLLMFDRKSLFPSIRVVGRWNWMQNKVTRRKRIRNRLVTVINICSLWNFWRYLVDRFLVIYYLGSEKVTSWFA